MDIELDTSPWEQAAGFLDDLVDEKDFRDLSLEAKAGNINEIVDRLLLQLIKTKLVVAETHIDFIRFQSMTVSLMQIRNALVGKLVSRKTEENGNGR